MEIKKLELNDLAKDSFFQTLSNLRPILLTITVINTKITATVLYIN